MPPTDSSGEALSTKRGVWRLGPGNWAYRFKSPTGGDIFGCGFRTREVAHERMREVKARLSPAPTTTGGSET